MAIVQNFMFVFRFSYVWFFDATSESSLALCFKALGEAAGIGQETEDIWRFLRGQTDWLLVFDNADSLDLDLAKYILHCGHGTIIITSRLLETHQMASDDCCVDIKDLEREEAITLLLKRAKKGNSGEHQHYAGQIVDTLGCYALAVDTAGAYLSSKPTHTFSSYLSRFNQYHDSLNFKTKSLDGYNKTVFSAFMLSFDQLTESAKLLMQICSCLHHKSIPLQLFQHAASFEGNDLYEWEYTPDIELQISQMVHFLGKFPEESLWDDSVNELCQSSLAEYSIDTEAFSFHPIYHACALQTMLAEMQTSCAVVVKLLLGRAIEKGKAAADYKSRHILIMHVLHGDNQSLTEHIRIGIARVLADAGMWTKCEQLELESFEMCSKMLGEHHTVTLTSMANLASTYCSRGKLEEAESLEEKVLKLRTKILGQHHPDTLTSMANLAFTYRSRGKLEEAESLEEEVLKLSTKILGQHHPDTLISMCNLASTYCSRGQLEEAESLEEEVLKLRTKILGQHHPDTLTSMTNLASTYRSRGKLEQAESLQEEVLKLSTKILGQHHPNTLISMGNLASTYRSRGKLEEAESLEEEVLKLRTEILGQYHPDTLTSIANLASTYWSRGKLKEAESLQEEVLKLRTEILGQHHPDTLISMANLANTYRSRGKLEEAESLEEEVLKLHTEILGQHHPDTLSSMANLAYTYWSRGKLEKAESLEEKVLKLRTEILGQHHPDTLTSMNSLASTYRSKGKLEEAESLEAEVLKLQI
jgi:tetratricopeptide (TPR) repeat protein